MPELFLMVCVFSAYIGVRDIKPFTVEKKEVDTWKTEVKQLISLTE